MHLKVFETTMNLTTLIFLGFLVHFMILRMHCQVLRGWWIGMSQVQGWQPGIVPSRWTCTSKMPVLVKTRWLAINNDSSENKMKLQSSSAQQDLIRLSFVLQAESAKWEPPHGIFQNFHTNGWNTPKLGQSYCIVHLKSWHFVACCTQKLRSVVIIIVLSKEGNINTYLLDIP